MTDKLDDVSRAALIAYRLQRAKIALEEADFNANGNYFNTAVNRLYYACYYAASALLLKKEISAVTHKGIKVMLGLHFISKGLLEPKFGRIYDDAFNHRHSGDYEDFVYCDNEEYQRLKSQTIEFVERIQKLIDSN